MRKLSGFLCLTLVAGCIAVLATTASAGGIGQVQVVIRQLFGAPIQVTSPTTGQVFTFDGTSWGAASTVASDWPSVLAVGATTGANSPQITDGQTLEFGASDATRPALRQSGIILQVLLADLAAGAQLSCPGALGGEQFGAGATAAATLCTALGSGADANFSGCTAVGFGAAAGTTTNNTALGRLSSITGGDSVGCGQATNDAGNSGSSLLGSGATSTGAGSVAVGDGATAALRGTALGSLASASFQRSIALGRLAVTTAVGQMVVGSTDGTINNIFLGEGVTSILPSALTIQGSRTTTTETDVAGTTVTIASGEGTGAAAASTLIFQTPDVTGTGTAQQVLATRLTVGTDVTVANGLTAASITATTMVSLGDNDGLNLGGASDAVLCWSTAQATANNLVLGMRQSGTTAGGGALILTTRGNQDRDHDHPVSTLPSLILQSSTDPDTNNTQFLRMFHNITQPIFQSPTGAFRFSTDGSAADGTLEMATLQASNLRLDGNTLSSTDVNGDVVLDANGTGRVVPLDVVELITSGPGTVGGFPAGQIMVRDPGVAANNNSVITGHNSFNGNTQLWYLGSSSGSNQNVLFLNRQDASLSLGANGVTRLTIQANGDVDVGAAGTTTTFTGTANATILDGVVQATQLRSTVGYQATATAIVATSDGLTTGLIVSNSSVITTTVATDADDIVTLPVPIVGMKIRLYVGGTGHEVRTVAASNVTINNVDSDGTNELALAASTYVIFECVGATAWICYGRDNVGADLAALVPDTA